MTNEYIIRIHDTKAMIYDTFNYSKFKQGFDYLDCIEEGTDYESYNEDDIIKLHSKLEQHFNEVIQAIKTIRQ